VISQRSLHRPAQQLEPANLTIGGEKTRKANATRRNFEQAAGAALPNFATQLLDFA
jgi:hypothetical protein